MTIMSFIEFRNVCKMYPGAKKNTVENFNLNIEEKEFIAFVGPSGCGKSTTLRMVAGFEEITGGELYIDGKKMNDVAPRDRGIAMVFQNYALYPHMTVEKNIGYGLKNMKLPQAQTKRRWTGPSGSWGWRSTASASPRTFPAVSAREWPWGGRL